MICYEEGEEAWSHQKATEHARQVMEMYVMVVGAFVEMAAILGSDVVWTKLVVLSWWSKVLLVL